MPLKNEEGEEINYSVSEAAVRYYKADTKKEGNKFTITNTCTPPRVDINVTKKWNDDEDRDGIRSESVTVKLLKDGEELGDSLVLSEENHWQGSFSDMLRYDKGREIHYTVEEEETDVLTGRDAEGTYKSEISGSASEEIIAEIPVLKNYIDNYNGDGSMADYMVDAVKEILQSTELSVGSIDAFLNTDDFDTSVDDPSYRSEWIKWNNEKKSTWDIDPDEQKWYAIKDADGKYHLAAIDSEVAHHLLLFGVDDKGNSIIMGFSDEDGRLLDFGIKDEGTGSYRDLDPATLVNGITITPSKHVDAFGKISVDAPISTAFTITKDNYDDIWLEFVDIDKIPDIADTDGDGSKFKRRTVVQTIYGDKIDVSEALNAAKTYIGIDRAEISKAKYSPDHKGQYRPVFTYNGETLKEGVDYTLKVYDDLSKPGTYLVTAVGIGRFAGTAGFEFIIEEVDEPAAEDDRNMPSDSTEPGDSTDVIESEEANKYNAEDDRNMASDSMEPGDSTDIIESEESNKHDSISDDTPSNPNSNVRTGDSNYTGVWISLLTASLIMLVLIAIARRMRRE